MKDLFQSLIWPAAAGNVVWAFFTVAIDEQWMGPEFYSRLIVLLLLAIYLGGNWLRTRALSELKPWYWIADATHVTSIVVFAIASQLKQDWLEWSLTAVLAVSIFGHITGMWEKSGEKNWYNRILLAGSNLVGLVVLFGGYLFFSQPFPYNLPISIAAVLTVWGGVRIHIGMGK